MGAELSCMTYKSANDKDTPVYDYIITNDSQLMDSMDLRRYCKHTSVCEQLPSHPAICLVNALICLSNCRKMHTPVPSILNIFCNSGPGYEYGTNLINCFKALENGVCSETECPYNEDIDYESEKFPPPSIFAEGICLKRVEVSTFGICEPLMNKCPVILTAKVTEELFDSATFTGDDDIVGELTFLIVGYNIHDDAFAVQDSHKKRFLNLPSQYIINSTYCYDAYALCPSTTQKDTDAPMFLEQKD